MRFDRIDAIAFGPLLNATLDLAPGMNVVYGPNEAGKSSWHAALYAGLCGIRRGAGQRKEEREFTERHKPWYRSDWEVGAMVTLADGRQVELTHDLVSKLSAARDANIAGKRYDSGILHDGAPDGSRWLGLNRSTFLSTACVRQSDMLGILQAPAALQQDMQRAAATAGENSTAAAALDRLRAYRREEVGTPRSYTKPLPSARGAVDRARIRLRDTQNRHADYLQRCEQVEQLERDAREARDRLEAVSAVCAEAEAEHAASTLWRIRELDAQFPDGAPHPSPALESISNQVALALERWSSRPQPLAPEGPTIQELQQHIDDAGGQIGAQRAAIAEREAADATKRLSRAQALAANFPNGHPPRASVEEEHLAERVRQSLSEAASASAPAKPTGPSAAEIETELLDFDAKVGASEPKRSWLAPALAGTVFIIGVALALLLPELVIAGAGLAVLGAASAVVVITRRPRAQDQLVITAARAGIVQRLESRRSEERRYEEEVRRRTEASNRLMLAARECGATATDEQSALAALRDWLEQWEVSLRSREVLGSDWDELQGLLSGKTLADLETETGRLQDQATSLTALADADLLAKACAQGLTREQLEEAERRTNRDITSWERAVIERRNADKQYAEQREDLAAAEVQLRQAGEAISATVSGIEELPEALEAWQQQRDRTLAEAAEQGTLWDELQNLLAKRTVDEVVTEADRLRRKAKDEASRVGADALAKARAQQPTPALLTHLEEEVHTAQLEHERASGELTEFTTTVPSVADAEEALANAERESKRLESLDSTLESAIKFLEDAQERVHQNIAPLLRSTVLKWLPQVTSNRYVDCRVDPESLRVDIIDANGRPRDASLLSHGTAEQVYLLLRLALTRHLTGDEPCPLILDDALAASDAERKLAILEMLLTLSEREEVQVILFTHEDDVRDWAKDRLSQPTHRLRELDPPAPLP